MMDCDKLLKKFGLSKESFERSDLEWSELKEIWLHHKENERNLKPVLSTIQEVVQNIPEVHSVRARVKDADHLVAKIIRKRIDDPNRVIGLDNYSSEITDLVGVRALHLFKDQWKNIHCAITDSWELKEEAVANIRVGDSDEVSDEYKSEHITVKEHPAGYRSIHYLIETKPCRVKHVVEIQVRTIFEEGWSEVDHTLRYPHQRSDQLLGQYFTLFNRLAGSADEMATFVKQFIQHTDQTRQSYKQRLADKQKEIDKLKNDISTLQIDKHLKDSLNSSVDGISELLLRATDSTLVLDPPSDSDLNHILGGSFPAHDGKLVLDSLSGSELNHILGGSFPAHDEKMPLPAISETLSNIDVDNRGKSKTD